MPKPLLRLVLFPVFTVLGKMKALIQFVLTVSLFVMFFYLSINLAKDPPVTSNFDEYAPYFHVLGIKNGKYEVLYLNKVPKEQGDYSFRLNESEQRIELADQSYAEVLENSGGVQRVKLFYSNTYMTESIYDVSENAIQPVKYQVLGSIGHVGIYLVIIVISAVAASLLSRFTVYQWEKRNKHNETA